MAQTTFIRTRTGTATNTDVADAGSTRTLGRDRPFRGGAARASVLVSRWRSQQDIHAGKRKPRCGRSSDGGTMKSVIILAPVLWSTLLLAQSGTDETAVRKIIQDPGSRL